MFKLGSKVDELDTPILLLDLDLMEENIKKMGEVFRGMPASIRPHAKTHKTPIIAHKQLDAGAIGITCAKVGEAEVMAEAGIKDLLIANQVVGEPKVSRLMTLARHTNVIVAVDDDANVKHLAASARRKGVKLNVVVEVNVGNNRCGVEPGEPALKLARYVNNHDSLVFRGLMGYEGFCQNVQKLAERKEKAEAAMTKLVSSKDLLDDAGLCVDIVTAGGTGTHMITGRIPGITEIEAGSYVFMDARYSSIEGLEMFGQALSLLTTVISTPRPGVAICDAGLKTVTLEHGNPVSKNIKGLEYIRANEEHGHLKTTEGALKAGDKIELVPTHCCTISNLHDNFYCIRKGELEAVWKIAGRGHSQ
jgi:D-serine deaminase-like pyridoxal phosphate-dependent protein